MAASRIWNIAQDVARIVSEAGFDVGDVDKSINRNGDFSAYFCIHGHYHVRISDHSTVRMYESSAYFVVNPGRAESVAADIIAELTSDEYLTRKAASEKAAAERTRASNAKREAERAAKQARLDTIHAEQDRWIAAKAAFIRANNLEDATETVRNRAWREHKKAMRA